MKKFIFSLYFQLYNFITPFKHHDFKCLHRIYLLLYKDEIVLNYQSIVSMYHNKVVGFEVLLRWHNYKVDALNKIDCEKVMHLANKYKLDNKLMLMIISKACKEVNMLIPKPDFITINLNITQFKDIKFIADLLKTTSNLRLFTQLILEVTEHEGEEIDHILIKNIHRLKSNGVKIALDDFGKCSSNLSRLLLLEPNLIKIDKLFTEKLNDENRKIILSSIHALMLQLNIEIIIEGIENEQTLNELSFLNIDLCQGYFFSTPRSIKNEHPN